VRRAAAAAHSLARAPRRGAAAPMRQRWMSPRMRMPSGSVRDTPPTMASSSAFFTSSWPKISGARLPARRSNTSPPATTACAPAARGGRRLPEVTASVVRASRRAGAPSRSRRAPRGCLTAAADPYHPNFCRWCTSARQPEQKAVTGGLPAPAGSRHSSSATACTYAPLRPVGSGVAVWSHRSAMVRCKRPLLCMAGRAHVDLRVQLIGACDRRVAPLLLRHDGGLRQQRRRSAARGSLGPERARSTPLRLTCEQPGALWWRPQQQCWRKA